MNFLLSSEQLQMQQSLSRFLNQQCPPTILHRLFDAEPDDDAGVLALWNGLVDLGLAAMAVPAEHDGLGLEMIDLAIAAEILGHNGTPGPFLGHSLATLAIALGGNDEQRSRWLPALASGTTCATIALADHSGGWQPDEWQLTTIDDATEAETGITSGSLTGTVPLVPGATHAHLIVVGLAGGALAVVEVDTFDQTATATPRHCVDRTRRLSSVTFAGARAEHLAHGAAVAHRVRDAALILLAADAFGGASRCVEMSIEYAKVREQFGVPIGQFQAVKHQLADTALLVEPARGLYWFAAHAFDHLPDDAPRVAALAKSHLTDAYLQSARRAIEIHGGTGYAWECDAHVFLKRAMFDSAYMGSPLVHRARAAALARW